MHRKNKDYKYYLKKTWKFIWEDDSIWSWLLNIVLAFVLIKFIVYPALGFILSTSHPIVAVVSGSMEHDESFDDFFNKQYYLYSEYGITKKQFEEFPFVNGFNKGDIMILKGKSPDKIQVGDILVFRNYGSEPIIHRVVKKWKEGNNYYFATKGDHNLGSLPIEQKISEKEIIGVALFRVPLIGYIKIWFVQLIQFITSLI